MNLNVFFKENNIQVANIKYVASNRFKDDAGAPVEWEMQVLSNKHMESIRNKYMKKIIEKNGTQRIDFDSKGFTKELMTTCIVYPNLNDKELQDSYGLMDAYELLQELLTVGEFTALENKIAELHNYSVENEKKVDDIKNF